jgi:aspartyl aminopeptidase
MVSANTGIKTIDVGNPMLSMHSIRETCGVKDTYECYALFKKFFDEFHNLKHNLF